jgi:erythromycin esterase-like protein
VGTLFLTLPEVIARDAVRLDAPFHGTTASLTPLYSLKAQLARADIVCLGEMNHFVHEKGEFRSWLTRWLCAEGWTSVAEELGWSDGVRVSRYLRTGEEGEFARLPSFNYRGQLRSDRDDLPGGVLKASLEHYPVAAFVAEQSRFYRVLRSAGAKRLFGIDIDGAPGGSYEDIRGWLTPFSTSPRVHAFLRALRRVPGEDAHHEAERLLALNGHGLAPDVGDTIAAQIVASLAALADSLSYTVLAYDAPDYESLRPAMAYRENAMKRRFCAAQELAGNKLVLMGHALHLARKDDPIAGSGIGPGGGKVSSLGHHLAQERGLKSLSIWMLYGAGEDSQPFPDLPRTARYDGDTLNAALAALGTPLLLPLTDPVFRDPVRIGHMYNATVTLAPAAQTDAIFFLPRVTPMHA